MSLKGMFHDPESLQSHFKAVLVAGRKWYGSLEHKTGFGEGVAYENTDVI